MSMRFGKSGGFSQKGEITARSGAKGGLRNRGCCPKIDTPRLYSNNCHRRDAQGDMELFYGKA
jgi:hypothetical protein